VIWDGCWLRFWLRPSVRPSLTLPARKDRQSAMRAMHCNACPIFRNPSSDARRPVWRLAFDSMHEQRLAANGLVFPAS